MASKPSATASRKRRDGPKHLSHSARDTLTRCPRSYFLRYFTEAPRRPAVWSVGGSAVHEATEHWDLAYVATGEDPGWTRDTVWEAWTDAFDKFYNEAVETEPNETKWGQGGAENSGAWREMGVDFVQHYIDWRLRSPWEIAVMPDDEPAIELDVSGMLPGCPVEIKGYIDRVMWDPVFEQHVIPDIKSGKKPPATGEQFETYKALLEVKYGIKARIGVHFLNRRATTGRAFDLSEITPEGVGAEFGEAWTRMREHRTKRSWPATKDGCWICDQQASCYEIGGPLAAQFDTAHPQHPEYTGLEEPPF